MSELEKEIIKELEKPRYRIQWDYGSGNVLIGYWVWTCNVQAVELKSSFYVLL